MSMPSTIWVMHIHAVLSLTGPSVCRIWALLAVSRCGLQVQHSRTRLTNHLAAGVLVLPEDTLKQLHKLHRLQHKLARQLEWQDKQLLGGILKEALFVTGEDCAGARVGWVQDSPRYVTIRLVPNM